MFRCQFQLFNISICVFSTILLNCFMSLLRLCTMYMLQYVHIKTELNKSNQIISITSILIDIIVTNLFNGDIASFQDSKQRVGEGDV